MTVPPLPDLMDQTARTRHRVDSGTTVYARRQINWPASVTLTDSSTDDEVQVAIKTWSLVTKSTDQTKTSDATLAADTDLQFSMLASTNYVVRGLVWFDTQGTPDFKYSFSGPASPTLVRGEIASCVAGGTPAFATVVTALPGSTSLTGTGNNGGYIRFEFSFQNSTNAATFSFNWAQDTSDAGGTRVRAGSYLEYAVA